MKSIRWFGRFVMATVLAAACVPAAAQTFSANEVNIPSANANTVVADRVSFNYEARIVQTLVGPTYDGNDPFTESGYLTKASFATLGSAVPSQLNALGVNGYGMYGLFTITGTATQDGGGIRSTFQSATMTLWMDPGQNTTLGFAGNTGVAIGGTGEDYAIANYTLNQGEGRIFGGLAGGDFGTILNIALTDNGTLQDGESFFASPFYALANFGGNTQSITGASLTSSFVATTTGAGTELFLQPLPEPQTCAVLLAVLGALGGIRRRRRRA